jgi:hypothetical protein
MLVFVLTLIVLSALALWTTRNDASLTELGRLVNTIMHSLVVGVVLWFWVIDGSWLWLERRPWYVQVLFGWLIAFGAFVAGKIGQGLMPDGGYRKVPKD